jgi:CRISPR/Cas system CSM-associated protein Csm3 (group 7 of RAMP superfamily)
MTTLERFNDLEVRLYKLTTKSHLRVGAGEGATEIAAVELPLIRALVVEGEGEKRVPYLPASSLHGVTRSWVEKVIRSGEEPINHNELAQVEGYERVKEQAQTDFKTATGRDLTDDELCEYWQVYRSTCNPLLDADRCETITDESKAWKRNWIAAVRGAPPCQTCAIFGYPGQRGRVRMTHAFPTNEELPVDIITRVAINRLTGAADEGKLFDLEAIPPGVNFYFFVTLENLSDEQKKLFDKGIRAFNLQLAALGAHSTVGFGMVEVEEVYAAGINPGIFNLNPPVEEIIADILKEGSGYEVREDLDEEKYPQFFLALSSWKDEEPPNFENQVTYLRPKKEG